jgi:hypothetical protein
MNNDFTKRLIKGKIAEVIFQQMFRVQGGYTIIPFGYEYTVPQLSQCTNSNKQAQRVIDNIKHAPDFALVSSDSQDVYLVEVKFRSVYSKERALEEATIQKERWDPSWLFYATLDGFYFDSCSSIVYNKEEAKDLSEKWVSLESQNVNLELLKEFETR